MVPVLPAHHKGAGGSGTVSGRFSEEYLMSDSTPTNAEIIKHMDAGFKHDERIRALETGASATKVEVKAANDKIDTLHAALNDGLNQLREQQKDDKAEIVKEVRASKLPIWQIIMALAALATVVLALAYHQV